MITTAEFKKQIARPFGQEMRRYGFKGTGFEYRQETSEYMFTIYIQPSRWGGSCSALFGVHPKKVDHHYYGKIDFKKLKNYQYEFTMSMGKDANGPSWRYADKENLNLKTLKKILETIRQTAFPVIEQFKASPGILDQFELKEMPNFHKTWTRRTGVSIDATTGSFAWVMALVLEKKNLEKAKKFANFCLLQYAASEKENEWFGDKDCRRILKIKNQKLPRDKTIL